MKTVFVAVLLLILPWFTGCATREPGIVLSRTVQIAEDYETYDYRIIRDADYVLRVQAVQVDGSTYPLTYYSPVDIFKGYKVGDYYTPSGKEELWDHNVIIPIN